MVLIRIIFSVILAQEIQGSGILCSWWRIAYIFRYHLLFFMIGTGLFVYFQVYSDTLPPEFREAGMADSVFPWFIINVLPAGLTGLLIASIFAAGMSTVSTSLNSSATVILNDFYSRFKNSRDDKGSVRVLYISSAIISMLGMIISFLIIRVESALQIWWNLAGIFSGGMLGIFLLGFISRKAGNTAAITGVITGLLVIIWMSLSPVWFKGGLERFSNPLHSYMTIVIGTMVIFFTGLMITIFINKFKKTRPSQDN
jgi:solute:Na+ symporter, SSS family